MIINKYNVIFMMMLILLIDQLSKNYVLDVFAHREHLIELTSFLNIILIWNKGITFGMLNHMQYAKIIFSALSVIITIILFFWMIRSQNNLEKLSLSIIIAGAIGNIIDRIRFGAVVDFIDFHIKSYHWYVFNIADSAICLGVALLLLVNIKKDVK